MKKVSFILGLLLLCIGGVLILTNFGIIKIVWSILWPLFLFIPGILFELNYFIYQKDVGLLVPAGILITYSILFVVNIIYGWDFMKDLWPVFPLGVAIGLLQLYIFGSREKGLLIPIGILGFISVFFLINNLFSIDFMFLAGIGLILIGLWVIFQKTKSNKTNDTKPESQ